jgi:hypothetical protein
VGSNSNPK